MAIKRAIIKQKPIKQKPMKQKPMKQKPMKDKRIGAQLQVPEGDLREEVERALKRIDTIHVGPDLPALPVIFTDTEGGFGRYLPERQDVPRHFEISRRGPHVQLTITHEIGHYLDHALGEFDVYLSGAEMIGEGSSVLGQVVQAMEGSQAIRALRSELALLSLKRTDRWQIEYWLDPREQWARAYAQFIAEKSGDADILRELEIARTLEQDSKPYSSHIQWEPDDFDHIKLEIELAFRKIGWMP